MKFALLGVGVWARGIEGFEPLRDGLADASFAPLDSDYSPPKPEAIPAKERRRAGGLINLAVQAAHEACDVAGVDKALVPSVFTSVMSDTALTDYMCRKLSGAEKMLSPTKFHNSVHNAPAGYWSISAENRAASSYVGGFTESVGAAFLEAVSQSHAAGAPVLMVAYDIANAPPFHDIAQIDESVGVGLVVAPSGQGLARGEVSFEASPAEPDSDGILHAGLRSLAERTPIGGALALAERCAQSSALEGELTLAASPAARLRLSFSD